MMTIIPYDSFWAQRTSEISCRRVETDAWVNAYSYFTENFIYPRGLPLINSRDKAPEPASPKEVECLIQQGLADSDPDVDAVFRMLFPDTFHFETKHDPVLLADGAWCPFNSQNTTIFKGAFPLLYLPAHCSFRMTDIWRSFVAQRILHSLGQGVVFHQPTVWQERNVHDLQRDFNEELPGYCHNSEIREALNRLSFEENDSLRIRIEKCYGVLMSRSWVGKEEEPLLRAWLDDLASFGS